MLTHLRRPLGQCLDCQRPAVAKRGLAHACRGIYKYKIRLAYDGTGFQGFQLQRHLSFKDTVQGQVEHVWHRLFQEDRELIALQAAGRTDSGVHAQGQVVSVSSNRDDINTSSLMRGMNALLPRNIRVKEFCRVPPDFSARYSSTGKLYTYAVHNEPVEDPLLSHMRLHVPRPLDICVMRQAARAFEGPHDFTQFTSLQPQGNSPKNPNKTINSFIVEEIPGGLRLAVYASGFLYRQVRHMAGAILAAGLGLISIQTIKAYLAMGASISISGRQKPPWNTAAAKGLCLEHVDFPPHDNPAVLMHPELPHDMHGRLCAEAVNEHL